MQHRKYVFTEMKGTRNARTHEVVDIVDVKRMGTSNIQ